MTRPFHAGFLLYPNLTQLDLTGPAQFLARAPGVRMHHVWKAIEPVPSDSGFALLPTDSFTSCPQLDLVCVPGGPGMMALLEDAEVLDWLRRQAGGASYVTSVCTGSLILGAAGLLQGYRSTCHWMWRDYLALFGAIPVNARVVRDRNRISGGGVTAGIDFALTVIAEIWGEETAKSIQLYLEYAPQPPFACGSPESAGPARASAARDGLGAMFDARVEALRAAAARLPGLQPRA